MSEWVSQKKNVRTNKSSKNTLIKKASGRKSSTRINRAKSNAKISHQPTIHLNNALLFFESFQSTHVHIRCHNSHDSECFDAREKQSRGQKTNASAKLYRKIIIILHEVFDMRKKNSKVHIYHVVCVHSAPNNEDAHTFLWKFSGQKSLTAIFFTRFFFFFFFFLVVFILKDEGDFWCRAIFFSRAITTNSNRYFVCMLHGTKSNDQQHEDDDGESRWVCARTSTRR